MFEVPVVLNFVLDITVIVLVELFTKYFFPGQGCPKFVLLSAQLGFLVISAAIVLLHHRPYLLLLVILGILIRLFMICLSQKPKQNQYLSSPLPKAAAKPTTLAERDLKTYRPPSHKTSPHHNVTISPPTRYNTQRAQENSVLKRQPLTSSRSGIQSKPFSLNPFSRFENLSPINYFQSIFISKPVSNQCPPGLKNSGNTCFVNSMLQCLIWTPGFLDNLSSVAMQSNMFVATLLKSMLQVSSRSEHSESVCISELLHLMSDLTPHLVTSRNGPFFQSQQDSAEFLLWLLNHVHTETVKKSTSLSNDMTLLKENKVTCLNELSQMNSTDQNINLKIVEYSQLDWHLYTLQEKSPIYKQFLGQLLEARECQLCNKVSLNTEYFMVLPLPLPKSTGSNDVLSLDECLNFFREVEDLTDSNMITCSCVVPNAQSLTPGKRRSLLGKTPSTLIIQLSRYSYNTKLQATVKNKACVRFSTTFQVTESQLAASSGASTMYKLVGICVHSGADNTSYGHYVAYCLTSVGWCYFNDETVSRVTDIEEVLKDYFILQNAYLLFYSCV